MRNLKQTKLNNDWLSSPLQINNRFAILGNDEQQGESVTPTDNPAKPPPIYIDRVSNIQPLTKLLNDIAKDEDEIKVLRAEKVKVQPKTTQIYTTIIKELQKRGTEFHTFKLKQERSFRVVLKNTLQQTLTN